MSKFEIKFLSPLEKCFLDEDLSGHKAIDHLNAFQGQTVSFQYAVYLSQWEGGNPRPRFHLQVEGVPADCVTLREIKSVGVDFPVYPDNEDENYLRTKPGMYPELLTPLQYRGTFPVCLYQTHSLWVDLTVTSEIAEDSVLTFSLFDDGNNLLHKDTLPLRICKKELPEQKLVHTEWFYTDCLANYYHTRPFSEKHWKIIENFMRTATKNGINMILTPIFTPELDTYIGGERLTTQLVGIEKTENGYLFDFSKLDRWVETAKRCGYRYFEIPHFFTQWGAEHCPKIIAKVKGKNKKIFGWESDAMGEDYKAFLSAFIPALLGFMKEKGLEHNCYFHVSDEPSLKALEHYIECKDLLQKYLGDQPIIDALSDFVFYESGALKKPAPALKAIEPFLNADIKGMWAYYCGPHGKAPTSNRAIAMPLSRVRILGVQLWKYNIEGFLHWGYNFYNNMDSYDTINPYHDPSCHYFGPCGDAFIVYPAEDSSTYESLRIKALRDAVEDMKMLDLHASRFGRVKTVKLLDEVAGRNLTFSDYPWDCEFFERLTDRVIADLNQ